MFFSNEEICQLSYLNMCDHQKQVIIHDLLDVLKKPIKFQLQLKLTLLWLWNRVKVTESGMNR